MYREDILLEDGTIHRMRRTVRLGSVANLSERRAWASFQPYLDRVNSAVKLPPKSGITLETFVQEWRSNVAVNLKDSTVRAANSHLRAHILPHLGKLTLPEINTKLVQAFVTSLATGRLSRKTIENVLLTLSSILKKAKAWDHATGNFSFADLTLPREGVKKEQRCFSAEEVGRIIFAAKEPFATIWALVAVLGLRVGEAVALRFSDLDFDRKVIRVRQSVDSATGKVQTCKAPASSADLPRYLTINGQPSQVAVLQINGRSYADVEALTRAVNGSVALNGNEVALTLPSSATDTASTSSTAASRTAPGLSKSFLKAGIEVMSSVRKWHSALANAIRNQYPIAESCLSPLRDEAATNLRLASVAASTNSDHSALPLLTNEFNNMKQLSGKYVAMRQSASYIAPDSLQDDDLEKKIATCGHALGALVASGQFQDDGSCQ
jgi:integrase